MVRMMPIIRPATPHKRRKLVSFKAFLTSIQIPVETVLGLAAFKFYAFLAYLNKIIIRVNKTIPIMD